MKSMKISGREKVMLVFLVLLLVGVLYYMGFYQPTTNEIALIQQQVTDAESQIASVTGKLASMATMQAELDEIFSRPEEEITEIAPYDNATAVMAQLNGILALSSQYSLNFQEPAVEGDGTVRRVISMSFSCADYTTAHTILEYLANSQWRCQISNLSINGAEDFTVGEVSVNATITYFESTQIS